LRDLRLCRPNDDAVRSAFSSRLAPVVSAVCGTVMASGEVPLPADVGIATPAGDVPTAMRRFVGAWGLGAWGGELPSMLVVERVAASGKATVVYAWGASLAAGVRPGWRRSVAHISDGKLHLSSTPELTITFEPDSHGSLSGYYRQGDGPPAYEELVHLPGRTRAELSAAAGAKPESPWEEIRIPERQGGRPEKTTWLQATVYRSPRSGRQPVIVFNHGSTGNGKVSASAVARMWNEAMAFREMGFATVVPMRRGRGGSGGEFLEEAPDAGSEAQLDRALADLDATVDFMREQSFVDPDRVIVAGQSRGGFLSVVYAARHPDKVAGVVNFSGGWWGERAPRSEFNFQEVGVAGRGSRVPMLWLYADHDSYYSLGYVERLFAAFKAAGGRGALFEVRDLPGEGHFLSSWPEKWSGAVRSYLVETVAPRSNAGGSG
jgi:pimeloyl-ACP methyl ester carboxylesterase